MFQTLNKIVWALILTTASVATVAGLAVFIYVYVTTFTVN